MRESTLAASGLFRCSIENIHEHRAGDQRRQSVSVLPAGVSHCCIIAATTDALTDFGNSGMTVFRDSASVMALCHYSRSKLSSQPRE